MSDNSNSNNFKHVISFFPANIVTKFLTNQDCKKYSFQI